MIPAPEASAVFVPATDTVLIFDTNGGIAHVHRLAVDALIADIRAADQVPELARNLQAAHHLAHQLRQVIRLLRMEKDQNPEAEALFKAYKAALGLA